MHIYSRQAYATHCYPYMATIQTICSKIKKEAILVSETSKVSSSTSTETPSVETYSRNSLSAQTNQNKLRSTSSELAEMDEVREENGRLKLVLSNMMQDYRTLQQHIGDLDHQKQEDENNYSMKFNNKDAADSSHKEDADLVVLSLGRSSSLEGKSKDHLLRVGKQEDDNGLALRLDSRSYEYTSDHNSARVTKSQSPKIVEEGAGNDQIRPSSKGPKTSRSEDDENLLQQIPAKKARVSVRAICNAPTMNDGCQWRKYGQKLAKGNPCPRAYYRCTISPSCPVRKHVQRCQEDMSILVTTYEGTHNHPLPPSATAMASTTCAAVSMLNSSSSTSTSNTTLSFPSTNSTNSINRHPFYIPNTTISTSQSHPTITLDLTTPSASSRYNKYSSTFLPPQQTTYSPAACLNFSAASSSSSSSFEHWRNQTTSSSSSLYRETQTQLPLQTQASYYQPYNYHSPNKNTYVQTHQPQFMEKIADVTKEITSNPSFQSALAAAISTIVGKRGGGIAEGLESSSLGVGFSTSYLSRKSPLVPSVFQQAAGNLKLDLPPFSLGKGPVVANSVEKGEHRK